ncbi:MAG: bifunctional (p)ppGpp synthetase/guanosine-3',5'-bis(diphosphate) 3'-pyrophosphohydrolase [Deltaproteobacteria bacterium]|nr:bifunctional (p)ppGpp synthetase/guanosine-3',5'-bis(diphosphate) 3'-pyrophosphohydrolase [Deltaproteobacteria bacterium]
MLRLGDILKNLSEYRPGADLDLVKKAYVYAAKVHQGQVRKSGDPYLIHPLEVAGLLTELRLDEQSVVTGLLHDTIEDTLATYEELVDLFGTEVADLVDGVTKLSQFSETRQPTAEEKQAENFRKMIVAMAKDLRVILVKLADRTHNMRTLTHMKPEKQERIARETLEIYAPLANRLGIQWVKIELEDLSFRYLRPHDYNEITSQLAKKQREHQKYIEEVGAILKEKLAEQEIPAEVTGRRKHLYSIYRKMRANSLELDQVHDLIAFRIITDSISRCYEALGLVHAQWKPVPGRFKDYIAMPKPNMYQSLHTTVIGPYGERVEIQIRTQEMHRVAEEGIAAHWSYKEGKKPGKDDADRFAWLRQLLEWQQDVSDPKEFLETVKVDLFSDEVFVFTPAGEVKSFPRGATPVDFAFSVHSEVGNHCVGAKVGGRIVPLRQRLKNGDTVEILTSPHAHPSKDWLTFVKTGRAQNRIRAYIRKQQRDRSLSIGRELFEKEARKHGRSLKSLTKGGQLQKAAEGFNYKTIDDLLSAIGYGKLTAAQAISRALPAEELTGRDRKPKEEGRISKILSNVGGGGKAGISIQGIDDVLVRFGRCCNPVPGDEIVGFITRGRGVTVHTAYCDKVLATDPDRRVDVSWDMAKGTSRPVSLRVVTSDRRGLLAELSQCFSEAGVNIAQANCRSTGDDRAVNTFEVLITDLKQLQNVITRLERIKGVYSVDRF